jgi:hypothetical protein
MHKIVRRLVSSLGYLALISCASNVGMSEHAKDLRSRMTLRQAESLLGGYARPSATRGGLCVMGEGTTTHLDYEAPVRVYDFVITFSAFYAAQHGKFALDARDLREIRVLEGNPQLTMRCRNYKTGYVVVLKPQKGLPDQADVSINASSQADLDTILAALTTLSPQARLTGGFGM